MENRTKTLVSNIKYSFLIKGVALAVSFLMVRVLIDKLNPDGYAIWIILSSTLGMLSFFNIGLGYGMRNLLFKTIAEDDSNSSREIVSTAYIMLGAIVATLVIIGAIITPLINWQWALNTTAEPESSLAWMGFIVFAGLMLQLELALIVNLLQAFQQTAYGNLINVVGQCLALLGVIVLPYLVQSPTLLGYITLIVATPLAVTLGYTIHLFSTRYRHISPSFKYFNSQYRHELLGVGGKFFVIQIAALIMYQSNNIIISHVVDIEQVTVFNIAYKYCSILQMLFILMMDPTWSAVGDAYIRKEFDWIRTTERRLSRVWICFALLSIIQCAIAPFVYDIWIGNKVSVGIPVTICGIVYFTLSMKTMIYNNIINGTGKIKLQYWMYVAQTILFIPLAIWAGKWQGICGVFGAMAAIQLINIIWMSMQYRRLVSNTATGIWAR